MQTNKGKNFLIIFIHVLLILVMGSLGYKMVEKSILGILNKTNGFETTVQIVFGFILGLIAILAIVLTIMRLIKILKDLR